LAEGREGKRAWQTVTDWERGMGELKMKRDGDRGQRGSCL
jgi:hypothetical protein